jgi:hypothetical protein
VSQWVLARIIAWKTKIRRLHFAWVREVRGNEREGFLYKTSDGQLHEYYESSMPPGRKAMLNAIQMDEPDTEVVNTLLSALSAPGVPDGAVIDLTKALDPGSTYKWRIKAEKVRTIRRRPRKGEVPEYKLNLTLVKRREGRTWAGTEVEDAIEIVQRVDGIERRIAEGASMKVIIYDEIAKGTKRSKIFADLAFVRRLRAGWHGDDTEK